MIKAPRGTADILPEEQPYWRFVENKAAEICRLFGYARIETPVFEDAALFNRSMGAGTDIVDKEMYQFKDRGDNVLALRPEGTAPVCRSYLEHGMHNGPQPVRLFYLITAFRYERPQAGRYRQHHQFGFEALGSDDPALDAEIMDMAWQFFSSLGLGKLSFVINSIGCKECRPAYVERLRGYYSSQGGASLCSDCQGRIERNPLRLLDCKDPGCQGIADAAPHSADHLCPECHGHFEGLKGYLGLLGFHYAISHRLVRGLDYYTRTVFEVQPEAEGAQSTLGGGGRYDGLIEQLGGRPTPGVGFATGIERIVLNLKRARNASIDSDRPVAYIAPLGNAARNVALGLASALRSQGLPAVIGMGERSLKSHLKQVDSRGIPYAVILGEDEVTSGTAVLRDMRGGSQQTVAQDQLAQHLKDACSIFRIP
ncbi:MAG: histidine--tRNA ligase [Chloroflexi bacterium]|nr:histidine--tRNA ligase [Chloroflexota bacterium]